MDARTLLELSSDGPLSRAQRYAIRSPKAIGEIVNPLAQAASRARANLEDAKFSAKLLRKMLRHPSGHTDGARAAAKDRLFASMASYRAWKAEAERIYFGMGR